MVTFAASPASCKLRCTTSPMLCWDRVALYAWRLAIGRRKGGSKALPDRTGLFLKRTGVDATPLDQSL